MCVARGKGCRVWDVDGNVYIDYILALGPITLGYCYDRVDQAVREQLDKGMIFGLLHPVELEAARLIRETVPCGREDRSGVHWPGTDPQLWLPGLGRHLDRPA